MLPFLLLTILLAHAGRGLSQSANTSDLYASEVQSYSIASAGANDTARNAGIAANRIGYQYGPSPLGNSSYFPTGPLADRVVAAQVQNVLEEGAALGLLRQVDEQKATQACQKVSGSFPERSPLLTVSRLVDFRISHLMNVFTWISGYTPIPSASTRASSRTILKTYISPWSVCH